MYGYAVSGKKSRSGVQMDNVKLEVITEEKDLGVIISLAASLK
jgi:hypothetical protein